MRGNEAAMLNLIDSSTRVSVIMIFLNGARFIEEAIESVLSQSYRGWELLLVDDGSTDASTAIAKQYVERYPQQIRYLEHEHHQNRGMSASRNLGLRFAGGDYVAFLDADDVWLPHTLEELVAGLDDCPEAGMAFGATQYWYGWTGKEEDRERDFIDFQGKRSLATNTVVPPPALLTRFLQDGGSVPCMCSLLVRREIVEEVGGFEEAFRGLYEDQVFYAKVVLHTAVLTSGSCLAKYRQHEMSSSARGAQTNQHRQERYRYLTWLAAYLREQGVKKRNVWRALQRALWPYRHPRLHRIGERVQQGVRQARGADGGVPPYLRFLSGRLHGWWTAREQSQPRVGAVRFGSLRRVTPISVHFGYDRGTPIDRYYIEGFLAQHSADIGGRVLEIGDNNYTLQFGGHRVTVSDVLHVTVGNPKATFVGDLASAGSIPSSTFDCIILTQTLHLVYDVSAAVQSLYRILKPGGVVLATFPGISQLDRGEWRSSWYWAFTVFSARRLFCEAFPVTAVQIRSYGNVLSAIAFLHGLSVTELKPEELDYHDPHYELVVTVRAFKPGQDSHGTS